MGQNMFHGAGVNLFARARAMRKQQTAGEEMLWLYLKQKPLGFKFRRQHPFGIYILDFYCHPLKLAIEVDGSVHEEPDIKANDFHREQILTQLDLQIIRFTNQLILTSLPEVRRQVEEKITELNALLKK